jgi:ketosteroid isomerase-like protein
MNDIDLLRARIDTLNTAWRTGRLDELEETFAPDVVLVAPGFAARLEGREACIGTYRDFTAAAEVRDFSMGDVAIDLFGDTAVAVCPYVIAYTMNGAQYRERGNDLLVFARRDGDWQVVWRTATAERAG